MRYTESRKKRGGGNCAHRAISGGLVSIRFAWKPRPLYGILGSGESLLQNPSLQAWPPSPLPLPPPSPVVPAPLASMEASTDGAGAVGGGPEPTCPIGAGRLPAVGGLLDDDDGIPDDESQPATT